MQKLQILAQLWESQVCSVIAKGKLKTVFIRDDDVVLKVEKTQTAPLQLWPFLNAKWCVNLLGTNKLESRKIQLPWLTKKCKMK